MYGERLGDGVEYHVIYLALPRIRVRKTTFSESRSLLIEDGTLFMEDGALLTYDSLERGYIYRSLWRENWALFIEDRALLTYKGSERGYDRNEGISSIQCRALLREYR